MAWTSQTLCEAGPIGNWLGSGQSGAVKLGSCRRATGGTMIDASERASCRSIAFAMMRTSSPQDKLNDMRERIARIW